MKGENFVFIGNQSWDIPIGSNCKNIAQTVAQDNRVLYINRPLDINTLLNKRSENPEYVARRQAVRKGKRDPLQMVQDGLYTYDPSLLSNSINWLPDGRVYDFFLKQKNKRFYKLVRKAIKRLGMKDFYFFNDNEMFLGFHAAQMLSPRLSIYYSRDNLTSTGYFKKHGQRLEPQLLQRYDLAVANSLYLKDHCAAHQAQSYYVGQGCDLSLFDAEAQFAPPADWQDIDGPVIGYIGALLRLRLDIELLEKLAQDNPEWSLVLVGPEDEDFKKSALHGMANVHFLGAKKPEELPAYLAQFDVAINPQELNPMTVGNYPRKVDEYLAMGKATVATRTRAMEIFADQVYLAEDQEGYQRALEQALAEDENGPQRAERIALAHSHTWENSVEEIFKAIREAERSDGGAKQQQ